MVSILSLVAPNRPAQVRDLLAQGNRIDAALEARAAIKDGAPLDEIVRLLASELESIGNKYKSAGRPKKIPPPGHRCYHILSQGFALLSFRELLIAREIVDGREVPLNELAWFAWRFGLVDEDTERAKTADEQRAQVATILVENMKEALELLLPVAKAELRRMGLHNKSRRKHIVETKEMVCKTYRVSKAKFDRLLTENNKLTQ
jgi:hypothetical protein